MFKRIDVSLVILLVLAVTVALIAFVRDRSLPMAGLAASGRLLGGVWLELLLGFIIAGFLEVLIAPSELMEWLGPDSPMKGILVGWGVGLFLPGGPYLLFPIAANLLRHGAAPGMLIALITAKTLVSPIRMLTYEAPLLGWTFTLVRCLPAVLLPPLMGLLGQWLFTVFTRK